MFIRNDICRGMFAHFCVYLQIVFDGRSIFCIKICKCFSALCWQDVNSHHIMGHCQPSLRPPSEAPEPLPHQVRSQGSLEWDEEKSGEINTGFGAHIFTL